MKFEENVEIYEIVEEKSWIEKLKEYPISYYLVAVNVVVFLLLHLTNILIENRWWLAHFAKISYNISMDHEYYRLFTAIFTHESISHLLFNCMALIILGKPIEIIFGKSKFLIIFLVAGLFGSLSSFIFSESISIGASGGIFGMFGVHLYLLKKNSTTYFKVFGKDFLQLLLINVIIGFVIPNIDYWGHFGGILGGFLATLSLGLTHQIKLNKMFFISIIGTIIIFVGSFMYFSSGFNQYIHTINEELFNISSALQEENVKQLRISREIIDEHKPLFPPMDFIAFHVQKNEETVSSPNEEEAQSYLIRYFDVKQNLELIDYYIENLES